MKAFVYLGFLCGCLLVPPALAQTTDEDLRRYEALVDKLRQRMGDYDLALAGARHEMRESNGGLSSARSAEVLHRKEQLELARSRLMALCAITGIPFPDPERLAATPEPSSAGRGADPGHGFDRARQLVRRSFSEQARRIARTVRLPVIDVSTAMP